MKYKVVTITNNTSDYPQYTEDTNENPRLVQLIEDEVETFVISETRIVYLATEFFREVSVKEFETL